MSVNPSRPNREELQAAAGKTVADILAPDLKILFCGINPGLYSAAIGHHFGRPGNRFWPVLFRAGLTARQLTPYEERELLDDGYGITNIVARATAGADELTSTELAEGGKRLVEKVEAYRPRFLAVLGIGAYRAAFGRPGAVLGRQPERIGRSVVWALPNPSGLNAHYDLQDLAGLFRELREAAEEKTNRP
ncbi:MAG TPA: G/U mismatch-specific DNA glycosylase [Anaerolineaceae bacterium]|nr:G/U mismatch-specific DNA glycosylase [Anaerolineaceae bacterium]